MNARLILLLMAGWFAAGPGLVRADPDTLPMPRVWNADGYKGFSAAEFAQQLENLKAERAALVAEWKALLKRSEADSPRRDSESQLQLQLKDVLQRLQQSRLPAAVPREIDIGKIAEPIPPSVASGTEAPASPRAEGATESDSGPLDALAQGHTLFRARQYEEALTSFRLVDLKGKKAEARAPVQYLMAICLLHLGKADEAVPLLRDVANSRGDEKLAGYAQWQLEMVRWLRDVQNRLQDLRARRLAVEKTP
ncbi:MAG TPA: hypothetical protein VNX28_10655 [Gemmataceae bacterium]|jgi:hypothetical protein|nr:hypothetical protein [Gemmataceae bacterium]